jgi:hypothetical protein
LIDAHNSYNNARINTEVSTLAELEMKQVNRRGEIILSDEKGDIATL